MTVFYVVGAAVSALIFIYLLIALLRPEFFS